MLRTGIAKMLTEVVTMENTARTLGSGSLLVYGTPAMLTLVEKTAVALLEGHLEEGMTSVGREDLLRRHIEGNRQEKAGIRRAGGRPDRYHRKGNP